MASALGSIKSLGLLCEQIGADAALIQTMNNKVEIAEDFISKVYHIFEKDLELTAPYIYGTEYLRCDLTHYQDMYHPYWYHPDHLGSSSYITNLDGEINQHIEYLPFGELLVDEHLNSHNSPFKFNAKELDPETGNYYYGARYYNPKWSIWLSVDPLAEFYPNWSPYTYTYHNPVRWTDSTGMCPDGGCPDDANDGDMHTASDGNTYMHQFGRWSDAPVTDLGNVSGNKGGERESTFEGKFISNGTSSKTQTKNNNIKNAIPCVECHHKTTFNQGSENQWDIFDLEKRQSGYIIYGGKMNSDFIGGTIGEDGVIYGAFDNLFAPSNQKSKIQILKYLIDLKGGLEIGSDLVELFLRGEEDIDFKTFNYTTTDTIWVTGGHREYRLYRPVEKKGYIIDKDTIK